jgi:hypothetical protein
LHLGLYLGFLTYEAAGRDWKNVTLILTVGLVNGTGWALLQNWRWASGVWPGAHFNWWRCWESSAGISIGIAYGMAYYLVNRATLGEREPGAPEEPKVVRRNLERFGAYLGLLLGLGLSVKNGLKGWANIHLGNEEYWNHVFWLVIGSLMIVCLGVLVTRVLFRPASADSRGDLFPHACHMAWLVLITQNVLAQLVTGPYTVWNEMAFKIYYLLLFSISAVIVCHFHYIKTRLC